MNPLSYLLSYFLTWAFQRTRYGERLGEFHGMPSQSHVSRCIVLPLGEFTDMIPEPHGCRVQSPDEINVMIVPQPGCNNSIHHIKNRFLHILFYFCFFLNAVWASGGFRIVSDTLVLPFFRSVCLSVCLL